MAATTTPTRREPIAMIPTPNNIEPKKHAADECALYMTLVHNIFIRAVKSIYYHAPYVKEPQDVRDFLFFCSVFVEVTILHHQAEETFMFPRWAEIAQNPGLIEENLDEHATFHSSLDKLRDYVTQTTPEQKRCADLYAVLDALTPPLVSHFTSEIDAILSLRNVPSEQGIRVWKAAEQATHVHIKWHEHIPFGLGCSDIAFEGGKNYFPPFPWILQVMVAWWYGGQHRGVWRFCPSDAHGRSRKPLFGQDTA